MKTENLITELFVPNNQVKDLKNQAGQFLSWNLTPRQICDLELIMNRGFYPLDGFLSQKDYEEVVENMRLADGKIWPIPITLDVSKEFADKVKPKQDIALRDQEGVILAILSISDKWMPNKKREAEKVFGSEDAAHPGVLYLKNLAGPIYLGGKITGIQKPCLLYTSPSPRDATLSRMPSSA